MNNVNMTNNHRDREMVDIHTVILTGVHLSKNDKDSMDYRISPEKAIRTGKGIFEYWLNEVPKMKAPEFSNVLEEEMKKEVAYNVKNKNIDIEILIPEIIEDVTYGISQKENEGDKETLNDILNERRIGGFAVCFEGAISQSMLQEHYDIKDYFGKADYVYSDCGDGEFSLVFYIAQYEDKTIDYLFNDDGYHCNDLNKEMEEERQRAKAADKRMELFERGFKEQFMYER